MPLLTLTVGDLKRSGQGQRLVDLFVAPNKLFSDIVRDRSWWLPFVITILITYTLTFSAAHRFGFRQIASNVLHASQQLSGDDSADNMTPEQQENSIRVGTTVLEVSSFSAPLMILAYNLLYAFALWIGLNVAAGGYARFDAIFAVLLYADLIQDLRNALATVFVYVTVDPASYNMSNSLGTNVAFYLNSGISGWMRTLLESLDFFTIWYLIWIALGCSIVAKISRSSAFGVVFGLWSLVVVTRVLWVTI